MAQFGYFKAFFSMRLVKLGHNNGIQKTSLTNIKPTKRSRKTMSNVMSTTSKTVRIAGLFALLMAFAAMFAAGSASAATSRNGVSAARNTTGTIQVSVVDTKTKNIVTGAEIEILNASGNVIAKAVVGGNTAETDTVQFTLEQGYYKMYINAKGYQTVNTQIYVKAGTISKTEVELQQ
jgi:hypothetical protein